MNGRGKDKDPQQIAIQAEAFGEHVTFALPTGKTVLGRCAKAHKQLLSVPFKWTPVGERHLEFDVKVF
jgi:hypothetical protein